MKKTFNLFLCCILLTCNLWGQNNQCQHIINIPIDGNTFVSKGDPRFDIKEKGITNWADKNIQFSSFFKTSKAGELNIYLRTKIQNGESTLKVNINDTPFEVKIKNKSWSIIPVGAVALQKAGYVEVKMEGIDKKGDIFADISDIIIGGEASTAPLYFVKEFSTYWGKRGPSVHLKYPFPENETIEYFYNEVTVPKGEDVIGSYYMANGFSGGYFGIQANSETERRVLFSVWSPYDTQDPKDIPEEYRIQTLARGEGVYIGEFGNEGSGGQSFLIYPWKTDVSYKFLTQVKPDGKGNTIYTSYFYATDENRWRLIASFLRPKTDTWYKDAYSFLENFIPNQGQYTRKVLFGNQWVVTNKGKWLPINKAIFTYDATARAGVRQDYKGGIENDKFFLQNCGFFDDNIDYNSPFERHTQTIKPKIDFKKLPIK